MDGATSWAVAARETHALLGTVEGPVEVRDRAGNKGVSAAKAAA